MTTNRNTIKDEILDKMTEEEMRCLVELLLGRSHIDGKISCKQIISNNKDKVRHIKSVELDLLIVTESLVNIELENKMNSIKELVMRSRYYSAMITSKYGLKAKQRYEELNPVIIMFIVTKKFQENNKSLVVLPEVISKEYYDSGERFIFLSTANLRSALSGRNYKKLANVLKPQSNDYGIFLEEVIKLLQGKRTNVNKIRCTGGSANIDKFNIISKGVEKMNALQKVYYESSIKILKRDLQLTLEEVIEKVEAPEEDREEVKRIYNGIPDIINIELTKKEKRLYKSAIGVLKNVSNLSLQEVLVSLNIPKSYVKAITKIYKEA